jgi:hypothetical protein
VIRYNQTSCRYVFPTFAIDYLYEFSHPRVSPLFCSKVRSDLQTFGFRQDLSRCPEKARICSTSNRNLKYNRIESVARDVALMMESKPNALPIGSLAEAGLSSIDLYHIGWMSCRSGKDPPPLLSSKGLMVPSTDIYNTMEHQMAKWAITNNVVELVLGSSIHREIVARSIPLIRFLAYMCTYDEDSDDAIGSDIGPNRFCLQASHLTLAWKTCTSKLDATVSTEVYHLLVSILTLHTLPSTLAIQLLTAIQKSLENIDGKDYLFEVAEFCSTLANGPDVEGGNNINVFYDEGRDVVLKLLWAVLTHPDAYSLKCYATLKSYVTQELRVEPTCTKRRRSDIPRIL